MATACEDVVSTIVGWIHVAITECGLHITINSFITEHQAIFLQLENDNLSIINLKFIKNTVIVMDFSFTYQAHREKSSNMTLTPILFQFE